MIEIELATRNFASAVRSPRQRRAPLTSLLIHSKLLTPGDNEQRNLTCDLSPSAEPSPASSLLNGGTPITRLLRTMADTSIKPDPEAPGASPAALSEDDIYEDAGDLEFNSDPVFQSLYLARVPKYVWEAWSKLDDDAEIQIGTLRMAIVKDANGHKAGHSFSLLETLLLI
jgi:hypothetical protein